MIRPANNVLNIEKAYTSTYAPKGKKGKKKKSGANGPRVGSAPKIAKSKGKGKGKGKVGGKGKGKCFQCRKPDH